MSSKIYRLIVVFFSIVAATSSPIEIYAAKQTKPMDNRYNTEGIYYYDPDDCANGSNGVVVGGEAVISGSTAAEKVWSGLKSLGLTDEVTAGIMGNMSHESNQFNPAQHEGSWLLKYGVKGNSFDLAGNESLAYGLGLIQWSFGRRTRMYNYVKEHSAGLLKYFDEPMTYSHANGSVFGVNGNKFIELADSESEVDALYSLELTFLVNEELKANGGYSGIFDQTTVEAASDYFLEHVEKPANIPATRPGRRSTAEEMFSQFSGKTSFSGGTGGSGNGGGRATVSAKNDGSNVTWIGDSISTAALRYGFIEEKWEKAHAEYDETIKGRKQFNEDDDGNPSGQTILERLEVGGRMRDILVFALGTNSPHLKEEDIKKMLNAAKTPKTIVLVTNYDNGNRSRYNSNNELIRKAKTLDRRVVIADWEAAVKNNPSQYFDSDDDIHPKKEGSKYFVEIIYRAAQTGYAQNVSGPNDSKCVCDEEEETGTWADEEFELTDEQVAGLLAIVKETSKNNLEAIKTEASYMINLYEDYNRSNTRTGEEFVKFVRMPVQNGGKFPNHAKYKEDFTGYSKEEFNAVKDIWVNGNRTMPVGIIKRAEIGKIQSATNDGESIDASNRKKYKSGKTKITSEGKTWIFYKFADNANRKGDAFGYPEDGAPNQTSRSTSTSAGASIAWSDDGWIGGGLDGFYKDEASSWNLKIDKEANAEFATEVGSGGGSGPNKILLHSSESAGGFESTVKSMYPVTRSGSDNDTASRPPHFTVDIKNHKTYQHFSIKRTSGAIQYHDDIAGIQINIIGYTNNETVGGEWNLRKSSNFSVDDWGYLVKLMMSISEKAGIKLQSKNLDWSSDKDRMSENQMRDFNGVIGHMHAANNGATDPNDIWKTLEPLFEDNESGTGECQIETSTNGDLNATALKLAWPDRGHSPDNPTEAYRQALLEPDGVGTRRQGDSCSITGKSCDAFVATVLRHSGVDKDVPCCGAANMLNYLANSSKYTEIENSASTLKGGDIRASGGHIEMVVEVNGELGIASASHCNRTGEVGGFYDNSFRAFRFTGGGN